MQQVADDGAEDKESTTVSSSSETTSGTSVTTTTTHISKVRSAAVSRGSVATVAQLSYSVYEYGKSYTLMLLSFRGCGLDTNATNVIPEVLLQFLLLVKNKKGL